MRTCCPLAHMCDLCDTGCGTREVSTDALHAVVAQFEAALIAARQQGTAEVVVSSGMRPNLQAVFDSAGTRFDAHVRVLVSNVTAKLTCGAFAAAAHASKDAACCGVLYVACHTTLLCARLRSSRL